MHNNVFCCISQPPKLKKAANHDFYQTSTDQQTDGPTMISHIDKHSQLTSEYAYDIDVI